MTQASLASAIGGKTTHTRVSEWENGKVEPERGTLMLIAQAARERYDPALVLAWLQEGGVMPPESVYGGIRGGGDSLRERGAEYEAFQRGILSLGSVSADAAQAIAAQIIFTRLVGRGTIPVSDVIDYLAAVVDAAAGRPVRLPPEVGMEGQGFLPGESAEG